MPDTHRFVRQHPPVVVLDTNVCLDLFVFASPRIMLLRDLLADDCIRAVTRADCRDEWLRVLAYPALGLNLPSRAAASARYDASCRFVDAVFATPVDGLPRCRDPDDQKFLELAHASGAAALLTRDAALLALARRTERAGLFRILAPASLTLAALGLAANA